MAFCKAQCVSPPRANYLKLQSVKRHNSAKSSKLKAVIARVLTLWTLLVCHPLLSCTFGSISAFFPCQTALVQQLARWKEYFYPKLPSELPVLFPICINNIDMDVMSGFKTLVEITSMARVVIINFNEPALRCKPIHIYPLEINIMELLTSLWQWHGKRLAPGVPICILRAEVTHITPPSIS